MGQVIKLGVIGLSDGNGHPYSWSAIFNGYSQVQMEQCGFPVIPRYLKQQTWPDARIKNAHVSCIWTQDKSISIKIANTVYIDRICNSLEEMAQEVDAVLLARDDYEKHYFYALPFLNKGIPIYIDKPLATSVSNAKKILSKQLWNGQIFSCSALRYDRDINIKNWLDTQKVTKIIAKTPKSWEKYSIHCIDAIVASCAGEIEIVSSKRHQIDELVSINMIIKYKHQEISVDISACGNQNIPISFTMLDNDDNTIGELIHKNTFNAFKHTLETFILKSCLEKKCAIDSHEMIKSIEIVERGLI